MADPVEFNCQDGCKTSITIDPAEVVQPPGWTQLAITGRWRCPECKRKLDEVNNLTKERQS